MAASRHGRPGLRLSPAARAAVHAFAWPGNVRQLEHALEAAAVLCEGPEVLPDDLPPEVATASIPSASGARPGTTLPSASPAPPVIRTLAEVEQNAIAAALDACGGNRSEAARRLGIGRNTLLRKLASAG